MTGPDRLEGELPRLLEHLYLGPRPSYADEALRLAVARPRRRAGLRGTLSWAGVAHAQPFPAQRDLWKTIVLVGTIVLLLAATAIVVGGRPRSVLPPADNGLIAYDHDGDIFVGDPVTGATTAIVAGPEQDRGPVFSPDGSLIAFVRRHTITVEDTGSAQMPAGWQPVGSFDIVVVRSDGSDLRVITPQRQVALESVAWAPDASSVEAVVLDTSTDVYREMAFDVTGLSAPHEVGPPFGNVAPDTIVSPTGDRVLILGDRTGGGPPLEGGPRPAPSRLHSIAIRDAAGGAPTVLVDRARLASLDLPTHDIPQIGDSPSLAWARWSPDGSTISFHVRVDYESRSPFQDPASSESWIYVMDADGSDLRRVTVDEGTTAPDAYVTEGFPSWSPDGTKIAVDRQLTTESGDTQCCAVIVADVSGARQLTIDPAATGYSNQGLDSLSWAPDGRSLLFYDLQRGKLTIVDAETGASAELPWKVGYDPDWQRVPRP